MPATKDDDDDDDDDDDAMDEDGVDDDSADDDAQSCSNLDYDFERGAELENSLLRLRHQWELKDQKRRGDLGEEETPVEPAAKLQPGGKSKKDAVRQQKRGAHQIFSSAEATRMLCNELFDLMKEEAEGFDGVSAQCVDLDIHRWRVQVRDLDITSSLHQDMQQLKAEPRVESAPSPRPPQTPRRRVGAAPRTSLSASAANAPVAVCGASFVPRSARFEFAKVAPSTFQADFGYDALELELQFTPDMHPFYPAWVKVLRPRFQEVAAEAAMSHPVMTLEGWDPMKPVTQHCQNAAPFRAVAASATPPPRRLVRKAAGPGCPTSSALRAPEERLLSCAGPDWQHIYCAAPRCASLRLAAPRAQRPPFHPQVKGLIRFVQSFLERHGRVALGDERNDPTKHPGGAYTGAEHCLCRLEILAAVKPHWSTTHSGAGPK